MAETQQVNHKIQYLQRLVAAGFQDIHVIRRETAERVLTPKRVELLDALTQEDVKSMRELARRRS